MLQKATHISRKSQKMCFWKKVKNHGSQSDFSGIFAAIWAKCQDIHVLVWLAQVSTAFTTIATLTRPVTIGNKRKISQNFLENCENQSEFSGISAYATESA